jgi:hypothetical protein
LGNPSNLNILMLEFLSVWSSLTIQQ